MFSLLNPSKRILTCVIPLFQPSLQENTRNPTAIFVGISSELPYFDEIMTKTVVENTWSEKKVRRKFVTNFDEIPTFSDGQYSDNMFHRNCFVGNWSECIYDRNLCWKYVRQNSDDDVTRYSHDTWIRQNFREPSSVGVHRKLRRAISSKISDEKVSSKSLLFYYFE